jgi:HSP20 family protein
MNDLEKKVAAGVPAIQPSCEICEENGAVRLRLEMPGVDKDGVEVSVERNELIITGKPGISVPEGTYLVRERRGGEYRKRFVIDETIDREKIQATVSDGVLTLALSTKESAKPKKVEIR